MAKAQLHLIIHGQVQGVFFRDFVHRAALELHLSGWVRNAPHDTVEVLAEGDKPALRELVERCKQGPQAAQVDKIDMEWEKPTKNELKGFDIRYD